MKYLFRQECRRSNRGHPGSSLPWPRGPIGRWQRAWIAYWGVGWFWIESFDCLEDRKLLNRLWVDRWLWGCPWRLYKPFDGGEWRRIHHKMLWLCKYPCYNWGQRGYTKCPRCVGACLLIAVLGQQGRLYSLDSVRVDVSRGAVWIDSIASKRVAPWWRAQIGLQDSCWMFGGNGGVLCVHFGLPDAMDDVLLLILTSFRIVEGILSSFGVGTESWLNLRWPPKSVGTPSRPY